MKNASQILSALNEPVFELDLEGVVVSTTAAADALAVKATGTSGYVLAELVSKREQARFTQSLKRVADGKVGSATVDVTMLVEGDVSTPMAFKLSVISGVNGKPAGMVAIARDLSLEKANEAAANVQGTHLLDLVENVSDACVVEGADGTVEMLNEAFCKLFHVVAAPQSMVSTGCAELFEVASIATEKRIGPVYFPLDAGSDNPRDELRFQLASGETVMQTSLAVEGDAGIAGRMHLFHCLTRLSHDSHESHAPENPPSSGLAEAQITLIEKIARELVVALESAGSAVLHGEQLELPSPLLNNFRRVEEASTTAFDSIASLLDFSRMEGAPIALESGVFNLRENVAALVGSVASHAEHLNALLRIRIEQDVPDRLIGDGANLMMVLRNLIDCALAAVPENTAPDDKPSEITLLISPEYSAEKKIHLAFSVEQIVRAAGARQKSLPPSAVMRLSIARQIVRAMVGGVGKIEVTERKLGIVYAFTADFPFEPDQPPTPRPTYETLTGLPVLIVSRNAEERKQLSDWLKGWRMQPHEADNATMAMQLLTRMQQEKNPIPLIITANELSVQDGFLLAFRVKQHPHHRHTAIILLAASGRPGDAITCRENGISAYLRQPIAPQQLNEAMAAVMGAGGGGDADATLVTRHSLRESKKASVLIIDAARDQVMFAAGGLKKHDYRVVVVSDATTAAQAMAEETFDVVVVDPVNANFTDAVGVVESIRANVSHDRPLPKILFAGESPLIGASAYDGMVLKPFAKDSLVNAVADILPGAAE